MIVEERIYTLQPGTTAEYLRLYEAEGMAIQTRILGRMVGYFTTEVGPLNQVIHLWAYDDMEDRAKRRAQMAADPGWQAYVKQVRPFVNTQENKILTPAPFCPKY